MSTERKSLGRVMMMPEGPFSASKTYDLLSIVEYDGCAYIARKTSTGITPGTDPAAWMLISAKGEKLTFADLTDEERRLLAQDAVAAANSAQQYASSVLDALNALTTGTDLSAAAQAQIAKNAGDIAKNKSDLDELAQKINKKIDADKVTELEEKLEPFNQGNKEGFYVCDESGNVGLQYNNNGFDVAKVSTHFLDLIGGGGGASTITIGHNAGQAFDGLEGYNLTQRVNQIAPIPSYTQYGEVGKYSPKAIKSILESVSVQRNRKKLCFIHTSDNHGTNTGNGVEYGIQLLNTSLPVDFYVNTGDLVTDSYNNQNFGGQLNLMLNASKPCYITLGNHDYSHCPLGAAYTYYFGNGSLHTHNGVSSTKTYYSVDYTEEKVKCIFLDQYEGWGDCTNRGPGNGSSGVQDCNMSTDQINWFVNELINAANSGLHVICFCHQRPVNLGDTYEDWTDTYYREGALGTSFLGKIIDAFQNKTTVSFTHQNVDYSFTFSKRGVFICWVSGHSHNDSVSFSGTYPNQLSILVRRSGTTKDYCEILFDSNSPKYSLNYVAIDTERCRLTIVRLGETKTYFGKDRDILSIKYNRTNNT